MCKSLSPAIALLGINLGDTVMHMWTTYIWRFFFAAVFVLARVWEEPECSSVGFYLSEFLYTHSMEYLSLYKYIAVK